MTTKSNNSSNGSGPSKFRKDAAIFSPSSYVHTNYVPNSPVNQLQPMMMGMPPVNGMVAPMNMPMNMNGNMMQNPMMPEYYNGYQYSPYGNRPNYEYNPYMPNPVFVPGYPYMANPMYNMNVGIPDHKFKKKSRRESDRFDNDKPEKDDGVRESQPQEEQSQTKEPHPKETQKKEPEKTVKDTLKETIKEVKEVSETVPEAQPQVDSPQSQPSPELSFISEKLPLYINSTAEDFFQHLVTRNQNKPPLDKSLIIVQNEETIIDYDTVETPKKNWASVISNSVKKPKTKTTPTETVPAKDVNNGTVANKPVEETDTIGTISIKTMFKLIKNPQYFKIYTRGLTNNGNICYMNSILQVLIYCEPFNQLFKMIEAKTVGSLGESKTPLIDAIIALLSDFNLQTNKSLSPETFYGKINKLSKFSHLRWGQQEDAEEFLGYLLDGLHEEFGIAINDISNEQVNNMIDRVEEDETKLQIKNAIKIIKRIHKNETVEEEPEHEWNEISGSKKVSKRTVEIEPSPIKTIFGGQFRSVLQISGKKEQSITLDPFQCIQLDIKDEITTIEEAFKKLNEPEQISFTTDNKEVAAKKQIFIDNLPPVLIIHLKRFSFENNNNIEKLRKKIEYNHKMTIPIELFSNWRKNINREYNLIGVVYHHGISAEGGHYTSDVLKHDSLSDKGWIRIDDTSISKIKEDDVLNNDDEIKNAYILLYQRV